MRMMARNKQFIFSLSFSLFLLTQSTLSFGQDLLKKQFKEIAARINGNVGVCALMIETGESTSLHGNNMFPMQSVYKFPIAMAILDQVDKGKFSLDEVIQVDKSEYIPQNGHSPIRDKFQDGVELSIRDLLKYNIEERGLT